MTDAAPPPAGSAIQFEISGRDSARLQDLYARLFGWAIQQTGTPGYGRVVAYQDGIPGAIGPGWDGRSRRVTVYVEVAHLEATRMRAEQLGGTVLDGPGHGVAQPGRVPRWSDERRADEVPEAGVSFTFIADPEGNVIGESHGLRRA